MQRAENRAARDKERSHLGVAGAGKGADSQIVTSAGAWMKMFSSYGRVKNRARSVR